MIYSLGISAQNFVLTNLTRNEKITIARISCDLLFGNSRKFLHYINSIGAGKFENRVIQTFTNSRVISKTNLNQGT